MKSRLPLLAALLTVAVAQPATASEEHQHHQAAAPQQLSLDKGNKWPTDEPLRAGMRQIRSAMADNLASIDHGTLTVEQYRSLGAIIRQQVSTIISQCKLEPRADAMLHIILADLLSGADAMQGKGTTSPASGAHQVVEAVNAYGNHFNHPGWQRLR